MEHHDWGNLWRETFTRGLWSCVYALACVCLCVYKCTRIWRCMCVCEVQKTTLRVIHRARVQCSFFCFWNGISLAWSLSTRLEPVGPASPGICWCLHRQCWDYKNVPQTTPSFSNSGTYVCKPSTLHTKTNPHSPLLFLGHALSGGGKENENVFGSNSHVLHPLSLRDCSQSKLPLVCEQGGVRNGQDKSHLRWQCLHEMAH